jgi:predicted CXXCH cytochrome family protein
VTGECHGEVAAQRYAHWSGVEAECRECHVQEGAEHEFTVAVMPALCGECHDELVTTIDSAENVHDPAYEDCLDCHDPHASATEGLLKAASLPELCSDCHDDVVEKIATMGVVHDPAEDGCLDCHDPHHSQVEGMLRAPSQLALCFECHDEEDVLAREFEHRPVSEGACTECHDPHASSRDQLLVAAGAALCAGCHEDLVLEIAEAEYVHDPAEDDCADCHQAHGGPNPYLLPAEGADLCGDCHDDVVEAAEAALVGHPSVLEGDGCLQCHSPHAGNEAAVLREPEVDLCLGCHNEPQSRDEPEPRLVDLRGWLDTHPGWHEPIAENGCTDCHRPHGGDRHRMLSEAFPASFYASFAVEKYALCFACHDPRLVTSMQTRSATAFRDGGRNLHFVHVNKQRRGRTCRACHDVHAGNGPRLIRYTVPFGKWMLPIGFEEADTGGTCLPGCHGSEKYDRGKE